MFLYAFRRFILFVITLLILTIIGYNIVQLDPESPWANAHYFQGWLSYITELSHLNFGISKQGDPIIQELEKVFPATLELCFISFTLVLFIGIPLGTISGIRQGKLLDTVISFIAMLGFSAPLFWVALLAIMFLSLNLELLPISGQYYLLYEIDHVTGFATIDALLSSKYYKMEALNSVLMHLTLPCLVLALAPTTQVIHLMRMSTTEVMAQNYIRAAKIKGLSNWSIVTEHVLRNAFPPIIPKLGVQLSSMITLAIITESIFNWPGIGRWLLYALANQDYISIQAGVVVVAIFVLSANILFDLLGTIANPLIRKEWYANR